MIGNFVKEDKMMKRGHLFLLAFVFICSLYIVRMQNPYQNATLQAPPLGGQLQQSDFRLIVPPEHAAPKLLESRQRLVVLKGFRIQALCAI